MGLVVLKAESSRDAVWATLDTGNIVSLLCGGCRRAFDLQLVRRQAVG